jgi:hypothetical protein
LARADGAATAGGARWWRRPWVAAAALFAVAAIALAHGCFFPIASLPEPTSDQGQMAWNLWHTTESVLAGHDPYVTGQVFHPIGARLITHTLAAGFFPVALAVKEVARVLGAPRYLYPFVAYKVAVLLGLWLLAFGTWGFFRSLGASFLEAVVVAIGYAFCCFYRQHAVHLNHLAGFFFPLAGAAIVAVVRRPGRAAAVAAGFTVGVSIYFTELFVFICFGAACYVAALAAWRDGRRTLRAVAAGVGAGGLALAVGTLVATVAFFVAHVPGADASPPMPAEAGVYSANLAGFFYPSPARTQLYARLLPNLDPSVTMGMGGWEAFVGFPFLLFGALGAWACRDAKVRAAGVVALIFFVLALGPRLAVLSHDTHVALPYAWVRDLGFMKQNRAPVRFVAAALFFWAIVVWAGLRRAAEIVTRWRGARAAAGALAVVAVWTAAECWGGAELTLVPSASLARLAIAPASGAVLNLPVEDLGAPLGLQIFHRRPIASGGLARRSPRQEAQLELIARAVGDDPAALDTWLSASGFSTVLVDGPLPLIVEDRLRSLGERIVRIDGAGQDRGVDRHILAAFGATTGVGALPDRWTAGDRLDGVRGYDTDTLVAARQVDVLADGNDRYLLELFRDGRSVAQVVVPAVDWGGLRWRALLLPDGAREVDRVEVRALDGDGTYAVRAVVLGG